MQYAGLEEDKLQSGLPGEMSVTSDKQMTPLILQKAKN